MGSINSTTPGPRTIRAAVPVSMRAAAIRTRGLIRSTLTGLGHLHQWDPLGHVGAVFSSGSTVVAINAAKPVGLWAAASRACGLIRATLVTLGMFDQLGTLCKIFLIFCLRRHNLLIVVTKLRDKVADASLTVILINALQDVLDTVDHLLG